MSLTEKIKESPKMKKAAVAFLSSTIHPRPRLWTRWFINPFVHKRGKGSKVCCKARLDVFPWKGFTLGAGSIIEDFAVVNNGAGDVVIGEKAQIGIGTVLVGPVTIGDRTATGPHVHISGFNHAFDESISQWKGEGLDYRPVAIGSDCIIGANSSVVGGVTIGNHVFVGAGSVVTKDLPDDCVAVGKPARVVKVYNRETKQWEKR